MALAGSTPNERTVRSWTSPSRRPSAPRSSPTTAPCGPRRCSTSAARPRRAPRRTPPGHRGGVRPAEPRSGPWPRHPPGATISTASAAPPVRSAASSTSASTQPAPRGARARWAARAGRPPRRRAPERRRATASTMPGVRTTRSTPGAVGPDSGRDRWSLGAPTHRVLAGVEHPHGPTVLVGQTAGRRPPPRVRPCPRTRRRWRAGSPARPRAAPRGVGLEVGRLDPRGAQRERPVARGQRQRRSRPPASCAGPAPCRPAGEPPRASRRPPSRPPVGHGHQSVGGAVSSANPPSPSATAAPTRWAIPPSSAARCGGGHLVAAAAATARPASIDVHASRIVCQPVQRQRWAASARSTAHPIDPRPGPLRRRPSRRRTMPGVQNPHWLPPVEQKAAAHASPHLPGPARPTVVISRPATRRTGVTHATRGAPSTSTVQQPHWPWGLQPSFTEVTCSTPRRASSSEPSPSTSTACPSREKLHGHGRPRTRTSRPGHPNEPPPEPGPLERAEAGRRSTTPPRRRRSIAGSAATSRWTASSSAVPRPAPRDRGGRAQC